MKHDRAKGRAAPPSSNARGKLARRKFLRRSAAVLGGAYVASHLGRARAADKELTVFTWETYHDDPWIAEYTAKTGVKINVVRTGSVDEMFAQASSGAVQA